MHFLPVFHTLKFLLQECAVGQVARVRFSSRSTRDRLGRFGLTTKEIHNTYQREGISMIYCIILRIGNRNINAVLSVWTLNLPIGCRNVGKELPLYAAQYRRIVQVSSHPFCPEVTCLTNKSSTSVISQTKGPLALAWSKFLRGNYVIIIG